MLWNWRLRKLRFSLYITKVQDVIGVKSKLANDKHMLMWDFDETSLGAVISELKFIQDEYALPNIYIMDGSNSTNFTAWCFCALSWHDARAVLCSTYGVDEHFIRLALMRGYFALRVTKKHGHRPHVIVTLYSHIPEKASIDSLLEPFIYEARAH